MGELTHFIVIRDYKPGDEVQCREIGKEGVMITVNNAFSSLFELTFQVMVLTIAILFIFFGFPVLLCFCSIPGVITFMYVCVYAGHMLRATELSHELINIPRIYMSSDTTGFWVAEAYEPCFMDTDPSPFEYKFFSENEFKKKNLNVGSYRKSLVGIVGIVKSEASEDCAVIRRMAVKSKYEKIGIGKALLDEVIHFSGDKKYEGIDVFTNEWHDDVRELYIKKGFQVKQLYHKKILGNIVMVLKYQLHYKIEHKKISITP